MPESDEHSNLVAVLRKYISERFCEGDRDRVLCDLGAGTSNARPPSIEGFIPDAYVMLSEQGRVVIGEAKSIGDLENLHADSQVAAFLKRCGMVEGSTFILAVPWPIERLARSLLMNFQIREDLRNVEIVVLSEASQTVQRPCRER
jgi:hypothetical protein